MYILGLINRRKVNWLHSGSIPLIPIERNKIGFPFIYKGKEHKYYPDFYLPEKDEYVEIKEIDDDLWEAKKLAFPKKLTVLKKKDIETLEKDLI